MVEERTDEEDRRLRFFTVLRTLSPELCSRLTQIDYEREMVLVAIEPGREELEAFGGVGHLAADPDRERAEYAILVRSDLEGQGLGTALTQVLIDYARAQGIGELVATVPHENRTMLDLAERQGFTLVREANDSGAVKLRLRLRDAAA